jgi:hypothetical protein
MINLQDYAGLQLEINRKWQNPNFKCGTRFGAGQERPEPPDREKITIDTRGVLTFKHSGKLKTAITNKTRDEIS